MKKIIGTILKVLLAVVVIVFLGSESIGFFTFVFPPEKWYMAYTGFGLTSGALIVYLYLFLYDADSDLKRVVALIMMGAGILGELATAGFGMQVEAWQKAGYAMTESDFNFMVLAVQILMLAHAVALLAYWAGDSITSAFADNDKDGTPDIFQPKKRNSPAPFPINQNKVQTDARDLEIIELRRQLEEAQKNPTQGQEPTK